MRAATERSCPRGSRARRSRGAGTCQGARKGTCRQARRGSRAWRARKTPVPAPPPPPPPPPPRAQRLPLLRTRWAAPPAVALGVDPSRGIWQSSADTGLKVVARISAHPPTKPLVWVFRPIAVEEQDSDARFPGGPGLPAGCRRASALRSRRRHRGGPRTTDRRSLRGDEPRPRCRPCPRTPKPPSSLPKPAGSSGTTSPRPPQHRPEARPRWSAGSLRPRASNRHPPDSGSSNKKS